MKIKTDKELFEMLVTNNRTPDDARSIIGYFCATEGGSPYDTWDDFKDFLLNQNSNMYDIFKNEGYVPSEGETIHTSNLNLSFRNLNADEVEVRPANVQNNKANLLLYQDARCTMNILDETVGTMNWQKEFYEANGLLFCRIGILNRHSGQWVWKSDTGSKSNIEEEKGLASDASKRAAVAWGIGRELYTAPKISVSLTDKDMFNGKFCQTFGVREMEVNEGTITKLVIVDKWNNVRFTYPSNATISTVSDSYSMETNLTSDITDFASTATPVVQNKTSTNTNTAQLLAFCANKKKEEGVDSYQLSKFESFYQKPSKGDSSVNIADSFEHFNVENLWERWINTAKR